MSNRSVSVYLNMADIYYFTDDETDHSKDGVGSPSSPSSDYFVLPLRILHNDVFHALAGLGPRKAYGVGALFSLLDLKTCDYMNRIAFLYPAWLVGKENISSQRVSD
ncbi:hypothetical protein E2C01_015891 [Portunus trituberculatus]|uniref:Uncharacterized protein n=1 Tax=Portunus trituberculatus TaxID=210409 RepID=A0A5B7DPA1_PORTR|nr:hypothetical protein [Portunus trituberculatus]